MKENKLKPGNTVETIWLNIDGGNVGYGYVDEYQLVDQYTAQTVGILRNFPDEYKFFCGRKFQWNDKTEQYEYFSMNVIVEFFVGQQKFYVAGENFYIAVERAILMQNYISKKQKERSK